MLYYYAHGRVARRDISPVYTNDLTPKHYRYIRIWYNNNKKRATSLLFIVVYSITSSMRAALVVCIHGQGKSRRSTLRVIVCVLDSVNGVVKLLCRRAVCSRQRTARRECKNYTVFVFVFFFSLYDQ